MSNSIQLFPCRSTLSLVAAAALAFGPSACGSGASPPNNAGAGGDVSARGGDGANDATGGRSSGGSYGSPAGAPGSGGSSANGGSYGYGGTTGDGASYGSGGASAPRDAGSDACISETLTVPVGIPESLVPPNSTLVHFLHAKGTQTYTCLQNPVTNDAGPPTYDWGTSAHNSVPEALVYDDCGVAKIHHYAGPTWEWIKDGSAIKGTKVASVAQPGTIAWLLLKASVVTPGKLSDVTYVQRLETTGGAPPTTGCDQAHEGDKVSVDYTAGYYFYTSPDGGP